VVGEIKTRAIGSNCAEEVFQDMVGNLRRNVGGDDTPVGDVHAVPEENRER